MLSIEANKIIPLYSDVITRFQAISSRYRVNYDLNIFYQQDYLGKFFTWQKECIVQARPSLEMKFVTYSELPEKIREYYNYTYFVIFSTSMGKQVDELINQYAQKGEMFKSYFIDSWFSECVEVVNNKVDNQINKDLDRSSRFSPGYGSIDITVNYQLFNLLKLSNIDVNPDTGILLPRKSTICLIGFNNHNTFNERWYIYENLQNIFK